ncbi:hypothetical protein J1N35_007057 [Gossypium stocksii]|uniref:Uncharacterized protein n=1 Tax=Gossypium stocksii TaxID=47602 RepID=A0A9D3W5A9_9ROSI|nr:hypothetical protein J1N35_007057 [Gossypium stocksii]
MQPSLGPFLLEPQLIPDKVGLIIRTWLFPYDSVILYLHKLSQNIPHFRLQQHLPASAVPLKKRGQGGCYRIPSTVKSACSMPVQKLLSHVLGIIRVLFSRKEESVLERSLAYFLLNGKGRLRRASTSDCQESLKALL